MDLESNEILLIDKPADMSSFGVVARVRRKLSTLSGHKVKVGHTGTLDPFATGLLVLLIGKGTKRANEFLKLDKSYTATLRLGQVSTTGDSEGEITDYLPESDFNLKPDDSDSVTNCPDDENSRTEDNMCPAKNPSLAEIEAVLKSFLGKIQQTVPQFSAVKINGQRAYKLARAGKTVEMPTREVTIYNIEIVKYAWPELIINCDVSSGTYIRTLAEDIGKKLGVGAYLTTLRRTKVGNFDLKNAQKLDDFMK